MSRPKQRTKLFVMKEKHFLNYDLLARRERFARRFFSGLHEAVERRGFVFGMMAYTLTCNHRDLHALFPVLVRSSLVTTL